MRRVLFVAAVLAGLESSAYATQTQVGVFGDIDGFAAAVQPATLSDCYVDMRLPKSQWVQQSSWAATSQCRPGMTPVVGIPMASQGENINKSLQHIANSSEDAVFNGIFRSFHAAGYDGLYIRPGWEMSGNWYPWSVTPGNVSAFIAAFRHIADLAHRYPEMMISVVWNPNVGNSAVSMKAQYPGDKAVDVIGLDTYGAPVGGPYPLAPSSSSTFTMSNMMAFAAKHNKPFALPETGGNDVLFVEQLAKAIVAAKPTLAFINVWNTSSECAGCALTPGSDLALAWKAAIATIGSVNLAHFPLPALRPSKPRQ